MRLVKNKIEYGGAGSVSLIPEEPEDMVCHPARTAPATPLTSVILPVARIQPHSPW